MTKLIILLSFLSICTIGFSQSNQLRLLSGKLVAGDDEIIGAPIALADEPSIETITNIKGEFKLQVPKNKAFKIHIGMCICTKHPKDVRIHKRDKKVLLKLKKCEIKKVVIEKYEYEL